MPSEAAQCAGAAVPETFALCFLEQLEEGHEGMRTVGAIVSLLLCSSGDLFGVLDFPFLYLYVFHGSCCAR